MQRIYTDEIIRVEAQRAYCRLITVHGEFTISTSLAALERQLPPCNLMRVHRSHMVNLLYVASVGPRVLVANGETVPLSGAVRGKLITRLRVVR